MSKPQDHPFILIIAIVSFTSIISRHPDWLCKRCALFGKGFFYYKTPPQVYYISKKALDHLGFLRILLTFRPFLKIALDWNFWSTTIL